MALTNSRKKRSVDGPKVCRVAPRFRVPSHGMERNIWVNNGLPRRRTSSGTLLVVPGDRRQSNVLNEPVQEQEQEQEPQSITMRIGLNEKEMDRLMPIYRRLDYKIREYTELVRRQSESMMTIEYLNVRPQFAIILPEPRRVWRFELDLVANPEAIGLLRASVFDIDQMCQHYATQLVRRTFGCENYPWNTGPPIRLLAPEYSYGKLPFDQPKPNQFMKYRIGYIILVCVIVGLCAYFLYHPN